MSRTYDLACKKCAKALWIGQGWPEKKRYIYGTEKHLAALQAFLFEHQGHELIFEDSEILSNSEIEYERLDEEDSPS